MATFILGVAGAAIGGAMSGGNALAIQKGWAIGTTIGGLIEATSRPSIRSNVGNLSDLRYSGSSYGVVIPRVWGKGQVAGNFIWVANYIDNKTLVPTGTENAKHLLRKVKKKRVGGGSGGGASTSTTTFSASYAVAFCEASTFKDDGSFSNRNPVVKKIWANDILIYDADNADNNQLTIRFHYGAETELPDSLIEQAEGEGNAPAYRGLVYAVIESQDLTPYNGQIPNIRAEIWTDAVTVEDICEDIFGQVQLYGDRIDFSDATATVRGYVVTNRGSAQSLAEPLLSTFAIDAAEIDGKLKLISRGGSSVVTISEEFLGVSSQGSYVPSFQKKTGVRSELPGRVDLTYFDVDKQYQQVTQSDIKQSADFLNPTQISVPITMTAGEAKQIASRILDSTYFESDPITISLSHQFRYLTPTDIITVNPSQYWFDSGRFRIIKIEESTAENILLTCVRDELFSLTQPSTGNSGSGGGTSNNTVPVPCEFYAWSGPELREEDRLYSGFYVGATWTSNGVGGQCYFSTDGGSNYILADYISERTIFGDATTELADGASALSWDYTNDVEVIITDDGVSELESVPESAVLNGENIALLGEEILGFATVETLGEYEYRLSDLRRGIRKSKFIDHTDSDKFVVVTPALLRVSLAESLVGTVVKVKVVAPGQALSDVTAQDVTIVARTPGDIETRIDALDSPKDPNTVYAGPATGTTPLKPTFRQIVNKDFVDVATSTIKGRVTSGTGIVEDLSGADVNTILPVFGSTTKGLVPAPNPAGSTRYLREDGTWVVPSGSGGSPGGSDTHIQYNNAGAFAGSNKLTWNDSTGMLYVNGNAGIGIAASSSYKLYVYRSDSSAITATGTHALYVQHAITGGVSSGFPSTFNLRTDCSSGSTITFISGLGVLVQATNSTTGAINNLYGCNLSARWNTNQSGATCSNIIGASFLVTSDSGTNQGTIGSMVGGEFVPGLHLSSSTTCTTRIVGGRFRIQLPASFLTGSAYAATLWLEAPTVTSSAANVPGGFSSIRIEPLTFTATSGAKYPILFNGTQTDPTNTGIYWGTDGSNVALYRTRNNTVGSNKSLEAINRIISGQSALTDGTNIASDWALANSFRVTLGGNRTLSNPTNAVNGQVCVYEIIQDGTGGRTLTFDSKFVLDAGTTISTSANSHSFLSFIYNSTADKFYLLSNNKSATKVSKSLIFMAGFTPSGTGIDDVVIKLPRINGASVSWRPIRLFVRVEDPSASTSSIRCEYYSGNGAFSPTNIHTAGDLSISGGTTYEASITTFSTTTLNSDGKLRLNFTALAGGHQEFYVELEVEQI